jgi:fatty-acid peroxygenase
METDIFGTRLLLRQVVCITGEDAAELFYSGDRFTRQGAMPPTTMRLLQDKGSVQSLDAAAHRHRKQMFMSLMDEASIARLGTMIEDAWHVRIGEWRQTERVVLHDAAREVLCQAVCGWAGVPLAAEDVAKRSQEFGAMIDGAGSVGLPLVRGMLLRARNERWARRVIDDIRSGALDVPAGCAAKVIASHREPDGKQLTATVAAVELINVLRPTVAIARFVVFAALALHEHPAQRQWLLAGGDEERELFVQEVRRFYPFFPFIGGRARHEFAWRGHRFGKGDWVLLDLYGTNHDPRIWDDPESFRPERFRTWNGSAFNFISQGGGDYYQDHRCPGEWITIDLLKRSVTILTSAMEYDVPEQDLRISLRQMPAIPKSRFVIAPLT